MIIEDGEPAKFSVVIESQFVAFIVVKRVQLFNIRVVIAVQLFAFIIDILLQSVAIKLNSPVQLTTFNDDTLVHPDISIDSIIGQLAAFNESKLVHPIAIIVCKDVFDTFKKFIPEDVISNKCIAGHCLRFNAPITPGATIESIATPEILS